MKNCPAYKDVNAGKQQENQVFLAGNHLFIQHKSSYPRNSSETQLDCPVKIESWNNE